MIDFKRLEDLVDALKVLIPKVKKDYEDMFALIAELKAASTGAEDQAKLDALTDQMNTSLFSLASVEDSFPPAEPAPTPDPAPTA